VTTASLRPTPDLAEPARDGRGRVLGLTRAGVWVLFILAAANGLFLYLAPGLSDTDYAWSIKPAINGAFIGAGFLAGTLATGLVLLKATRWRSFSLLPPALWVLASTLLAATIIHEDRFKWDYAPTWVWAFVYAGVPLAIPFLAARQRRVAEPLPAADPRLRVLRVLSGVAGAALLAGAAALYVAPVEVGEHWLWALTPLLGRAVAAWYALFGTMLLTFAIFLRRPFEGLIGYATLACWCVLLLALPVLHSGDVSGGAAWYALMLALLALAAYGLRLAWPERREL
jgi:MFS family permease